MGRPFYQNSFVKNLIQIASQATNKDIEYLLNDAPQDELDRTEHAQIALFTLNYALFQLWLNKNPSTEITMLAGHSLGQYVALAIAEILSFEDSCRLILARSELMSKVCGKMLAILGVDFPTANTIASLASQAGSKDTGADDNLANCCFVANYNASGQFVLSGSEGAIIRAQAVAAKMGKKSLILATSGPFHSPFMYKACQDLFPTLEKLEFKAPKYPVISNVFATADVDPTNLTIDWKEEAAIHMKAPVRWFESLQFHQNYVNSMASELDLPPEIKQKYSEITEIGANSVLANMTKRDGFEIRYNSEYL